MKALNKESGSLGVCGASDNRDIEQKMAEGDKKAILSNKMYCDRIAKYIADYYIELEGKVDAIVFTAGVGENAIMTRKEVLERLKPLGIVIDEDKNNAIAGYKDENEGIITSDESKVTVYVVPTDEELMIALDTVKVAKL